MISAEAKIMQVNVRRRSSQHGATIGTLDIDGVPICYTLEDAVRERPGRPVAEWKVPGETAIPAGSYTLTITRSNRFGRDMPLLVGVPGFEGVRIHPGNTAADTEGCILVGYTESGGAIGRSRDAFAELFPRLRQAQQAGQPMRITVGAA